MSAARKLGFDPHVGLLESFGAYRARVATDPTGAQRIELAIAALTHGTDRELPEVVADRGVDGRPTVRAGTAGWEFADIGPERARAKALELLAIARHIEASDAAAATQKADQAAEQEREVEALAVVLAEALEDPLTQLGVKTDEHPEHGGPSTLMVLARTAARRALADAPPEEPPVTDHEFQPVDGHPDDDECTYGAWGSYCARPRDEHDVARSAARPGPDRGTCTQGRHAPPAAVVEPGTAAIVDLIRGLQNRRAFRVLDGWVIPLNVEPGYRWYGDDRITNIRPDPRPADVWAEGFEAGATWSPSGPSGIPNDPPPNPYERPDGGA